MAPAAGFEPASFSLSENSIQTGVTVPNARPDYTMRAEPRSGMLISKNGQPQLSPEGENS